MKKPSLAALFFGMLTISACTFGGGFVMTGLMKKKYVDRLRWMDEQEMMDYVAIAQSCPGPIAVNAAILTGLRLRGAAGVTVALLGMILPPMFILTVISLFYEAFAASRPIALLLRGMQAGVAAVIFDVVLSLGGKVIKRRSVLQIAVMAAAFAAVYFLRINVAWVMLAALLAGAVRAFAAARRKEADA